MGVIDQRPVDLFLLISFEISSDNGVGRNLAEVAFLPIVDVLAFAVTRGRGVDVRRVGIVRPIVWSKGGGGVKV